MSEGPAELSIREEVRQVGSYRFEALDAPVKLDQNESPWPPGSELKAAIERAAANMAPNRYPDLQPFRLRQALAERHDWDVAGVTVAGGSNVLIQSLVIAAGVGRTVLTVSPTFSVYALQARLLAGQLREVPLKDDFGLDLPTLSSELHQGSGVLFIASPAAPTGNLHARAELEQLIETAGDKWLVVIDEAYQQFSGVDNSDLARRRNVVVLRTFSKAAGLAGVRLGYALSSADVGEQLQKIVIPFSVSALQEELGLALLRQEASLEQQIQTTIAERGRMLAALRAQLGVQAYDSAANFILFRVSDAEAVHRALLERGVLVRRQDHLPGLSGCLRVSVGLENENSQFISALAAIMAGQPPTGVTT